MFLHLPRWATGLGYPLLMFALLPHPRSFRSPLLLKAPQAGPSPFLFLSPSITDSSRCAHLVYGNAEFSLGVWPVKFYLSLVSPHLQQDVTKILAQSCKQSACPGLPGLSPLADPSLFSLHSLRLKWARGESAPANTPVLESTGGTGEGATDLGSV